MDFRGKKQEEENDKRGTLLSLTAHVVIAALFFMPISHKMMATKDSMIQVELPKDMLGSAPSLGLPNEGSGSKAAPGKPDPNAGNSTPKPTPAPPVVVPTPAAPKPVFSKPVVTPATPPRKVETMEDPNAAVIRRQAEEARKRVEEEKYQQQAAQREKQRQADAARQAETDARNKAAAAAAAEQAAKDKFKGRFGNGTGGGTNGGGGTGTGRGNNGTAGNQGKPDGDPNSDNLNGLGKGPGTVNGFGGRGVKSAPKLSESSQKTGKVVLEVCIDGDGNVLSTKFKPVGSTTSDGELVEAATRNAKQYQFAAGSADKQCGTITYNFSVR